ncbi:MAG: tRNA (cytidine(34)-2'-O)-methyltransferase [Planctomycetes bacterium]|nr:tRNA (cytidine(34)-2'-O)-methyltransferase [Planctomycetota bacterium]
MEGRISLHIVLYEPEIPQNTGAIGRTCVAVGAKLWLVRPLGFRMDEKSLRRAGLDYWQHLTWQAVDNWADLTESLRDHRFWFFSKRGGTIYTDVQFSANDVLVFGNETSGLPTTLVEQNAERTLRIPIRAEVRSLNLSNSVAIAAYEALRQFDMLASE